MNIVAIIPARGGSKGIPKKNIIPFCGQPLISWSILQARHSKFIKQVFVSSDDDEILACSKDYGAEVIKRPDDIAGDQAPSELAWLHAVETIEKQMGSIDLIVGIQATSPLRETKDLDEAIELLQNEKYDTLFSSCKVHDNFIWERHPQEGMISVNYDWKERRRRQDIRETYVENGSFYIFPPKVLKEHHCRLWGRIGTYVMAPHKSSQVDHPEDLKLCEILMKGYQMDRL